MTNDTFDDRVAGLASLGEPVRRALYRFVAAGKGPVSRDEAADGVGVPRHVAKFHLDRLQQDGLLEVEFSRPPGRGGPGAGRPTKRYRRAARELSVSLPERRYDLAGQIMARAITASQSEGTPLAEALRESATATGRALGEAARHQAADPGDESALLAAARAVIDGYGFESRPESSCITLANCPFHALAEEHRELVCGLNLDLFRGLLAELGNVGAEARLEPAPGRCCVTIHTG